MKYWIIQVDGSVHERKSDRPLTPAEERAIVGAPGSEHVKVLRGAKARSMIVNECGAGAHGHERLPPNARATAIYWENSMAWSVNNPGEAPMGAYDPLTMPMIHGDVILYEGLLP